MWTSIFNFRLGQGVDVQDVPTWLCDLRHARSSGVVRIPSCQKRASELCACACHGIARDGGPGAPGVPTEDYQRIAENFSMSSERRPPG